MKPDVLSDEKRKPYLAIDKHQVVDKFAGTYDAEYEILEIEGLLEAQRDADVAYYEDKIYKIIKEDALMNIERIQQAKAEVAREIFEEIEAKMYNDNPRMIMSDDYQAVKSKYLEEAQ